MEGDRLIRCHKKESEKEIEISCNSHWNIMKGEKRERAGGNEEL